MTPVTVLDNGNETSWLVSTFECAFSRVRLSYLYKNIISYKHVWCRLLFFCFSVCDGLALYWRVSRIRLY